MSARVRAIESLRKHDLKAALELCIARMLERGQRGAAFEKGLALAAGVGTLLAPLAKQHPAAKQILLQHDLVVARSVGTGGLGLHEEAHRREL